MELLKQLKLWSACNEGYAWTKEQGIKTLPELWDRLERPDWMIWTVRQAQLADKLDRKALVEWACQCAERVLPIYEKRYPGKDAPRKCIEVTRLYMQGKATKEALVQARRNAYAAAAAAYYAAYYDAYAAAAAAAYAAAAAAYYAAAAAAYYAAAAAARTKERKWQADKLRELCANPFQEAK